jgi:hypothetical protein
MAGADLGRDSGGPDFGPVEARLLCGRRGNLLATMVRRIVMPPRFGGPVLLRNSEFQESE